MTSLHLCDSVGNEDLFCDDNWQSFFKRKKTKMPKIEIDAKRCKGCGFCVKFCPKNLIQLDSNFNDKGYHPAVFKNPGDCTGCGLCALVCPDVGITVYK